MNVQSTVLPIKKKKKKKKEKEVRRRSGSGFFIEWHINHHGLFNAKAIFVERELWYYLTYSWENKRVHAFPKGISSKVNLVVRVAFKLTYYNVAV